MSIKYSHSWEVSVDKLALPEQPIVGIVRLLMLSPLLLSSVLHYRYKFHRSAEIKIVNHKPYGRVKGSSSVQCNAMISKSVRLTWPSPLMSPAIIVAQTGSPKYVLLASTVHP